MKAIDLSFIVSLFIIRGVDCPFVNRIACFINVFAALLRIYQICWVSEACTLFWFYCQACGFLDSWRRAGAAPVHEKDEHLRDYAPFVSSTFFELKGFQELGTRNFSENSLTSAVMHASWAISRLFAGCGLFISFSLFISSFFPSGPSGILLVLSAYECSSLDPNN